MYLRAVRIRQWLEKGVPAPFVLGNVVAQADDQGTIIPLGPYIDLRVLCGHGDVFDAEAGQCVLKISCGELRDIFR